MGKNPQSKKSKRNRDTKKDWKTKRRVKDIDEVSLGLRFSFQLLFNIL